MNEGRTGRWPQVSALLDEALALEAAQRPEWLARLSGVSPEVLDEVRLLLDEAEHEGGFFARPASSLLEGSAPAYELAGQRIGAYRVLELVGRGGMGEVYRAERADGEFEQVVALKLIRRESVDQLDRFHAERRVLAGLDHPGIARLFDGGTSDDGRPYMVMEWVDGQVITDWCTDHHADLATRLDVFLQVCDAVGYAHRNLLVHRDLKPANVMVTAEGRTKLLDFGIAKLVDADAEATLTQAPMTLAYASPEQLLQKPITTATDVYALGLVLFELLTDRRPWHRPAMLMPVLVQKQLSETAPAPSGSTRFDAPVPPKLLRGDLDAIVAKALRREPEHRYETVAALQADIRRHLAGEPVAARRGARGYVLSRFLLQYRWAVAGVVALVLTLAAGLAGTYWQARRAEAQARRAEAVQSFLEDVFRSNASEQPDPVKARQTTARELLDIGRKRIEHGLADAPEARLSLLKLLGSLYQDLELCAQAAPLDRQVVELMRQYERPDSIEFAEALMDLAAVLDCAAANRDAGPVLQEAAAILEKRGVAPTTQRGILFRRLANHYLDYDRPRALELAGESVKVLEAAGPPRALAESLASMGWLQEATGSSKAAVATYQRAIALENSMGGGDDYTLVQLLMYLSDSQYEVMQIADAERNLRTALARALAKSGEEVSDVPHYQMRLGRLLVRTGRVQEGFAQLAEAERKAVASLGEGDTTETLWARFLYGEARVHAGDLEGGAALIDRVIATCRASMPGNVSLARFVERRADVAIEQGAWAEASSWLDEAARARVAGGEEPDSSTFFDHRLVRARLELAQGHADVAARMVEKLSVDAGDRASTDYSPEELDRDLLAARAALALGDNARALADAREVRAAIERAGVGGYLEADLAESDLVAGEALQRSGDAASALPLLERALELRRKALLATAPAIGEAQVTLAGVLLDLGRKGEAGELVKAAKALEDAHPVLGEQYRGSLEAVQEKLRP